MRQCESDVCLNGGTCEVNDEDRSFRCLCPQGFQGLLCESEEICSLKCHNNGVCVFSESGKQSCNCSKGIFVFPRQLYAKAKHLYEACKAEVSITRCIFDLFVFTIALS